MLERATAGRSEGGDRVAPSDHAATERAPLAVFGVYEEEAELSSTYVQTTLLLTRYTVDGGDTATVSMAVTCVAEPLVPPTPTPETTITKAPKKLKAKSKRKPAKAQFEFSSSLPGATFECALDSAAPTPCSSPASLKVKKGKHTFAVTAIVAGAKDPTPATAAFTVKAKRKKRK